MIRKLSVVILLAVLIATSVGAVSQLSSETDGIGTADNAEYEENTVIDSVGDSVIGTAKKALGDNKTKQRTDGQQNTANNENKDGEGEWESELSDSVDDKSGLLNGGGDNMKMGGGDNEQTSYSTDSITSFVADNKFSTSGIPSDYWKTGTAGTYTSTGFKSDTVSPNELDSLPTISTETESDTGTTPPSAETGTITLDEPASRVPIPGDVSSISIKSGANPNGYKFKQTPTGGVVVTTENDQLTTLPEGTELSVTAEDFAPQKASKPVRVEQTETPGFTSNDVKKMSNEITAEENADTPDEKATAIQNWLQENKEYNASAEYDNTDDPVGEFITSDTGGSAKHFSGATALMLREQGVPARVATGYNDPTTNSTERNDYSSLDQHAWTEYGSSDGEWNAIDTTPSDRGEAINQTVNGDDAATNNGVPKEVINDWADQRRVVVDGDTEQNTDPGGDGSGAESESSNDVTETSGESGNGETTSSDGNGERQSVDGYTTVDEVEPPYDITVNPTPIPGKKITTRVTKNNEGVAGVGVEFNNEYVGRTNREGELTAQVPYERKLTITTTGGGDETTGSFATTNQVEFTLPENASINADTAVLPGRDVELTVSIDGETIPGVDVFVNGENIGRTASDGSVAYAVPEGVASGDELSVRVERGSFEARDSIRVTSPELRVDNELLSLPMTSMTVDVVAEHNGETTPLADQDITVVRANGNPVAESKTVTTNANGSVALTIPFTSKVTTSGTIYGAEKTTALTGIYAWVGGVIAVTLFLIVTVVGVCIRKGITPQVILNKIYAGCFWVAEQVTALGERIVNVYLYVKQVLRSLQEWVVEHGIRSKETLVAIQHAPKRVKNTLLDMYTSMKNTVNEYITELKVLFNDDGDVVSVDEESEDDGGVGARKRIRQLWWLVVSKTIGSSTTTKTPAEIGEMAIGFGFTKGAVVRVRDGYRAVRYGEKNPEEEVNQVEKAGREIKRVAGGESKE